VDFFLARKVPRLQGKFESQHLKRTDAAPKVNDLVPDSSIFAAVSCFSRGHHISKVLYQPRFEGDATQVVPRLHENSKPETRRPPETFMNNWA
jgi:hypothetical protein